MRMNDIRVISLFDGISCGRVALERAGIRVDKYYASEIDKFAIKCSKDNYPDIIHIGDVEKWKEWDIDWSTVDLVTGGFPCQAWSVAGLQLGDKDPRGALFWTTLDIIKNAIIHNPNVKFIMENVKMKKDFEQYITYHTKKELGYVEKTLINSSLVSAQNRQRYYWTNFPVTQPEDKGIFLEDIVESEIVGNGAIRGRYNSDGTTSQRLELRSDRKTNTLTTVQKDNVLLIKANETEAFKKARFIDGKAFRNLSPIECERLQTLPDDYTKCLSNTQRLKTVGNGWTIEIITHIFKNIKR